MGKEAEGEKTIRINNENGEKTRTIKRV